MKKHYLLLITLIFSGSWVFAQQNWPSVIEIKADTAISQNIDDKYWQLLEDPSGKLTINQVSSPAYNAKFHINATRTKGYDYHIDTYWLRYRFKNILNRPVKLTVRENVAYAWIYISQPNNKWKVQTTGEFVPWSKRDGLKRIKQLVVELSAGQEITIYERDIFDFRNYKPQFFQFSIGFANPVINKSYVDNDSDYYATIIYSVVMGVLLLAALTNLLFFRIVREKVYLYLAFFELFFGLYYFTNSTENIILREHRYLNFYVPIVILIVAFFSMMHFIRHFLSTNIHTPRWDKVMVGLSYLQILAWLAILLPSYWSYHTYVVINLVTSVIIYTYMSFVLGTLLFYIPGSKGYIRTGIFAALPCLFVWGVGYFFLFISSELNDLYKVPFTKAFLWFHSWSNVIMLICFFWLVAVFSRILFRRFRDLQQMVLQSSLDKERLAKEKEIERSQLIEQQNAELERQVEARTAQLKKSIDELKTTQQQLVQSEKLASLGELTAGIAHEIQNPLNFVNNFSEVSVELTSELKEELKNGNTKEAAVLADDIEHNLEKIIHHGKRADGIVKNMLQHSRNNSGEKKLTDVNALADEYMRLSYHGLRAKDKSFNSAMETHLNSDLPQVNVVPQDIGRVLLNLFNNAFYTVHQKKKQHPEGYFPLVTLTTSKKDSFIEIAVTDNGNGIPESIKDKIMQPFFTTKPTGEGTGLGLSLSYDIVVKGHGGSISAGSTEGQGSEFIIKLPL
ncbi:MAG: integral rane sensor signal transduction histidine kinase [Mucilaginibacter sp.]|nr:integral rane sensor signal transduction histidine kinase [Mucilaginibacter sp.]